MKRGSLLLLLFATTCLLPACAAVKPWEREHLARPDMEWDPDILEATRCSHIYFSKEASLAGSGTGGGGCGCN